MKKGNLIRQNNEDIKRRGNLVAQGKLKKIFWEIFAFFVAEVEYRTKMGLTKTGDGDHGMHRSIVATQQQVNP